MIDPGYASVVVEALGATGVIVTLLYLAKETRLNTAQIQTDSLAASIGNFVAQILLVSQTAENSTTFRQCLHSYADQDAATQNGFHAMLLGFVSKYNHTWRLYQSGLLSEDEVRANQRTLVGILRSPGSLEWWESWKHEPPEQLTRHIDNILHAEHLDVVAWSNKPLFRLEG